jgi:hypothetical protein
MAGSEAPRDEALSDLEQARRDWNEASRELKDAHQEQQGLENQIRQAFADGDDTSSLQFHLHYVKERYQRAKERNQEAKERYQELKEKTQRSPTAGESHAYHPPSCVGPATPTSFCSDVSILVSLLGRRSPEARRHQALRFRVPLSWLLATKSEPIRRDSARLTAAGEN